MKWVLTVKNFGKIKEAVIHDSSLRFIVGDNNSGKSYLMTLLWGMGKVSIYFYKDWLNLNLIEPHIDLSSWLNEEQYNQVYGGGKIECSFLDYEAVINRFIKIYLNTYKNDFAASLFNFKEIKINNLSMQFNFDKNDKFLIYYEKETDCLVFKVNSREQKFNRTSYNDISIKLKKIFFLEVIISTLLESIFVGNNLMKMVYLPAARTGFMLTKDIINRAGRENTFGHEKKHYEPFTAPIMDFLDIMETIQYDIKLDNEYEKICDLIENKMLQGKLFINDIFNKTINFIPDTTGELLPLRTTSAVVTEISPLYLLLKNKQVFFKTKSIYYEEPEMCLHPQLQQIMARVLIGLVNANVNLTVTTHSDIIIQHINNMIRLNNNGKRDELMQKHGYESWDLLKSSDISMYQFKKNDDGTTTLEELKCGKYGFAVPTFNDALDKILEEVYDLQGDEE